MAPDERFDESISTWFEETAPARLPERVLDATFERTRRSRQHVGWHALLSRFHMTRLVPALGGAAVVVMAAALALNFYANQPGLGGPVPASDPPSPFLGIWVTTDGDGSTPTMTVRASGEGALEIVVLDDLASVCSGAPSTMTGTGRLGGAGELVIPSPTYTCDDGSEPEALSGPPFEEQLRNLTFVYNRRSETLTDNLGGVWAREGAEDPSPEPTSLEFMWPQTSLEEARRAQELADAGDPRYTWQVDAEMEPSQNMDLYEAEFFARFLREELGWEEFQGIPGYNFGDGFSEVDFIRCAPGRTNPLYPNDPEGRECTPTIDAVQYETVRLGVAQPVREGPSGIWVVTRWGMIPPLQQVVPPSDAEATALLAAFLQARIDGDGAEQYVDVPDPAAPSREVPLLYATTAGARYERSEFAVIEGPVWPRGEMRFQVRLLTAGGATVVEQLFLMNRDAAGRLRLEYEYNPVDAAPTTENGQPVLVQYRFVGGEVTFSAAWPWYRDPEKPQRPRLITLETRHGDPARHDARLAVVDDPRPIERGCEEGPAPADVQALIRSIQADPDLEVTDPVAVTLGGLRALRMDVATAPGASVCELWAQTLVVTGCFVDEYTRMRLYLLELPGASPRILAVAMTAPKSDFERVMELEAPILDSFEFHPG